MSARGGYGSSPPMVTRSAKGNFLQSYEKNVVHVPSHRPNSLCLYPSQSPKEFQRVLGQENSAPRANNLLKQLAWPPNPPISDLWGHCCITVIHPQGPTTTGPASSSGPSSEELDPPRNLLAQIRRACPAERRAHLCPIKTSARHKRASSARPMANSSAISRRSLSQNRNRINVTVC